MASIDDASVDFLVRCELNELAVKLEDRLQADVMAAFGPIFPTVEHKLRRVIESLATRRTKMVVVLETGGGVVEVVERMVTILRHNYEEITFIVPDRAMSAGTVLVMSGDCIMMDYFACLGPIDPQIEKDGKLIPALSYLVQYDRLIEKSRDGTLTTAEFALLQKLDLAELHQFEEARELSVSLLIQWLTKYKFKNWNKTETHGHPITEKVRVERAKEIADALSDNRRWHSHGRGIPLQVLRDELKIKIDDFGDDAALAIIVRRYHSIVRDYMVRQTMPHFMHTRTFF